MTNDHVESLDSSFEPWPDVAVAMMALTEVNELDAVATG